MFRSLNDFYTVWNDESAVTQKVLAALTDASLSQAVSNDHRTLGRMAWHIAQTVPEMMTRTGLTVEGAEEHAPVPKAAKEIADAYARSAVSLPAQIRAKWSDASLDETDEMYGEKWTRSFTLRVLVLHQVHHRGQMSVLMRQAGVRVPSMYGPTKEEWAQWNMQPPAV
jgi:uncharacterized damage-inducible protein DinB